MDKIIAERIKDNLDLYTSYSFLVDFFEFLAGASKVYEEAIGYLIGFAIIYGLCFMGSI